MAYQQASAAENIEGSGINNISGSVILADAQSARWYLIRRNKAGVSDGMAAAVKDNVSVIGK